MASYRLRLLLFLMYYTVDAHRSHCKSLYDVLTPDPACPRYITMHANSAGLGDQTAHLYTLLAAACRTGRTVVLHASFISSSVHQAEGYRNEFEYMGIPIHRFLRVSNISLLHQYAMSHQSYSHSLHYSSNAKLGYNQECHSLVDVGMEGCYGTLWCFGAFVNEIHALIYPLLREMIVTRDADRVMGTLTLLPRDVVNIVLHMRTEGNYAPFIEKESYYQNVIQYIEKSLGNLPFQLTIIGESAYQVNAWERLHFLKNYTNVHLEYDYTVMETLDAMLGCDVLFQTGSSFSTTSLWLTDVNRPIILESISKETYSTQYTPYVLDNYQLPEGRSIRIDETGHCLHDLGDDYILNSLIQVGKVEVLDGVHRLAKRLWS